MKPTYSKNILRLITYFCFINFGFANGFFLIRFCDYLDIFQKFT